VVFRPELEAAFSPKVASSARHADVDQVAAQVLAAHPDSKLTRILLPTESRNTFVLTLESGEKQSRKIIVDAGTGNTVGELKITWLDWLVDLHHNLLFGKTGRQIVGVVGIILFTVSGSGLILFLLRKPSLKSLTTIRVGGPKRRFYYELHRATGLWAYSFLTLLSFTGIALAYPDAFRAVLGKTIAIPKSKQSAAEPFKPLSDYLTISRAALPDAQLTEVRLPKSTKDPVSVRFRVASDLGTVGRNEIVMNAAGRVLGVRRIAEESAGVQLQGAFTPIHYAEVGGLIVKLLWTLAGIAPTVLFVTGILFWFRKKPRRDIEHHAAAQSRELSLPLHN
jgi:uncharacterized iron-regulated membrane protein